MKVALGIAGLVVAASLLVVKWPVDADAIGLVHVYLMLWALAAAAWACDLMDRFWTSPLPVTAASGALLAATLMLLAAAPPDGTLLAMAVPLLAGLVTQTYRRGRHHRRPAASSDARVDEVV